MFMYDTDGANPSIEGRISQVYDRAHAEFLRVRFLSHLHKEMEI